MSSRNGRLSLWWRPLPPVSLEQHPPPLLCPTPEVEAVREDLGSLLVSPAKINKTYSSNFPEFHRVKSPIQNNLPFSALSTLVLKYSTPISPVYFEAIES